MTEQRTGGEPSRGRRARGLRAADRRPGRELPARAAGAVAREADGGAAISLLLLEVSQVLLAGARLGVQADFTPREEYQPDVGPDPDLDAMRLRLGRMLDNVDTYFFEFDPYDPERVDLQLSDDLTSIATDLANGLRHYRAGNVDEALWWWQFSYVGLVGQRRQRGAAGPAVGRDPRPARQRGGRGRRARWPWPMRCSTPRGRRPARLACGRSAARRGQPGPDRPRPLED